MNSQIFPVTAQYRAFSILFLGLGLNSEYVLNNISDMTIDSGPVLHSTVCV